MIESLSSWFDSICTIAFDSLHIGAQSRRLQTKIKRIICEQEIKESPLEGKTTIASNKHTMQKRKIHAHNSIGIRKFLIAALHLIVREHVIDMSLWVSISWAAHEPGMLGCPCVSASFQLVTEGPCSGITQMLFCNAHWNLAAFHVLVQKLWCF